MPSSRLLFVLSTSDCKSTESDVENKKCVLLKHALSQCLCEVLNILHCQHVVNNFWESSIKIIKHIVRQKGKHSFCTCELKMCKSNCSKRLRNADTTLFMEVFIYLFINPGLIALVSIAFCISAVENCCYP